MGKQLEKVYNPKQFEDRIYRFWMESGYFRAQRDPEKKPYTIVIPPPNITGQLHMGHALDETLQDILIRLKRMQGYVALWLPGTDHASIATEAKIVEAMRQDGVSKEDIGRDGFLERAWDWKEQYGGRIIEQLKKLGASCDWSRQRFTLDEGCSEAVKEFFIRLYEQGLIYRGERIIHWCPHCMTSISDAEVEYEEQDGCFWHLRYPFADGDGYLELATTRPETLLGDTAVAVHPKDERYRQLVGKQLRLPLTDRLIPIVADDYVDMEFGTGVVKITPAHDPNDFEVGMRHQLTLRVVLTEDAKMTEDCGKYAGMDRYQAREEIVRDLEKGGFLVRVESHSHNVGTCYRCKTTIEPRVSLQWFVKMKPLADAALAAVRDQDTVFVPSRFEKLYFHWMEHIRDWCISRQLWWGHRIPVYYCQNCGEMIAAKELPDCCPKCGDSDLLQDEDTLDTWFSSALWPFSTLGWPEQTDDLTYFYPTATLVTGYDIITFWVSRMITAGLYNTGVTPFRKVLIHGLVRDERGRKMSKSLGNGIDPLEVVQLYGADALRFMLASGTNAGNDMRYSEEKVKAARNFANKLWNAARFILMNLQEDADLLAPPTFLEMEDRWILTRLQQLVDEMTRNLESFEISVAAQKIYDFIWNLFCDWYIELCKARFQKGGESSVNAQRTLVYVMTTALKLLHPFMPFITEEIYQALPRTQESIMVSDWPVFCKELVFEQDATHFEKIVDAIREIRNVRSQMQAPPSRKAKVIIQSEVPDIFKQSASFFVRLASAEEVVILSADSDVPENTVQLATDSARIFLPLVDLIDYEKERARLLRERTACEKEIASYESKLSNAQFVEKAPPAVVKAQREKLDRAKQRLQKLMKNLQSLEQA